MTDQTPARPSSRAQTIAEQRAAVAVARRQATGTIESQSATGTAVSRSSETAAAAVAAHAEAMAKARFFVAIQRPRDLELVRERLLQASADPLFAEDATYELERWDAQARESKPIKGFSARFAEACRTALGNIDVETTVVVDDDEKIIAQVIVTDLEANVTERVPLVVRKRVERRKLRKGQVPIASRTGADGQTVHIVAATDDEVQQAFNSAQSKATRNAVLRLVRSDIRQECWDQVMASQRLAAQQAGATARAVAAFRDLGVTEEQLCEFLGRKAIGELSPKELDTLRGAARAIRDGEATWGDLQGGERAEAKSEPKPAPAVESPARLKKLTDARRYMRTEGVVTQEQAQQYVADNLGGLMVETLDDLRDDDLDRLLALWKSEP